MTVPPATQPRDASTSKILRAAIWVAIGALIAAAIVCVIMVLVGTANGIVPRAFLTILLMVAFAGVALLDTYLAPRRPIWFALTSMIVWVVTLLIGAVMIWMPFPEFRTASGAARFMSFLLIVLILQLGVLHVRLFMKAWQRHVTTFTSAVFWVTVVLVALLAIMLVFPLMLNEWVRFHDLYWRLTVAVTILAAVGTALVPLVNALLAPREPRPHAAAATGWPTYADGVTPLPMLADGQPDWNAYYTGYPSVPQTAPQAPGAANWAPPTAPAAPVVQPPVWPAPEATPPIAPQAAPPQAPVQAAPPQAPAQPAPAAVPDPAAPAPSVPPVPPAPPQQ